MIIEDFPCVDEPVMLAIDNINWKYSAEYGSISHKRITKENNVQLNTLNYTVRGAIKPDLCGIEDLFADGGTALQSQKPVNTMKYEDILIENNEELYNIIQPHKKKYFLDALDTACNKIPDDIINNKDESEFKHWCKRNKIKLKEKKNVIRLKNVTIPHENNVKGTSKTLCLPLSFENSATKTGMSQILDQLASDFDIPVPDQCNYLPFDETTLTFSVLEARQLHYFNKEVKEHIKQQQNHLELFENLHHRQVQFSYTETPLSEPT